MTHAVLIVDDEATLARNLAAYLERNGFDVRVAGSGEEGLQQFAEFRPDVVLLDHNLPGISGLEVLERLAQGRYAGAGGADDGLRRHRGGGAGPEARRRRLPDQTGVAG